MEKYIVRIEIAESSIIGKRKSQKFEYEFEDENLFSARKEAIRTVIELTDKMVFGFKGESTFQSLRSTEINNLDFFNYFTVEILFCPEKDLEVQIFGDEQLMFFELDSESSYYKLLFDEVDIIDVVDEKGINYQVLKSDVEFFIDEECINNKLS